MSRIEAIVEDLKALPPDKLEMAAAYIRTLKSRQNEDRDVLLARTFASISQEEAAAILKAIEEGCERIDAPRSRR